MPLLERTAQLASLAALHQEAAAGSGSLVLVSGEAGVGKTALVRHFCDTAGGTSTALTGGCDPLSTPRPLGPLIDISVQLDDAFRRMVTDDSTSRIALFGALLERMSAASLLITIEDIHWADEATLDLIRFLGRRVGGTKSLLIATFRDDEAGSNRQLRLVLGDLATAPAVHRMTLPPLSLDAVSVLAEGTDLDPDELYRLTDGNPFFVTEIVLTGETGLPATVRDAVLARAARLPPPARAALDAAAVIGSPAALSLVEQVGRAEPGAIDECVRRGLLRLDQKGLHFRHELARRAVLEEIPPTEAIALNSRVLAVLRDTAPHDLARLAHHAAGAHDRDAVLIFATGAARRATSVSAHREAEAFYALANRFAGGLSPSEQAALLLGWSRASIHIDEIDQALQTAREALVLLRHGGDAKRIGDCLYQISLIQFFLGNGAEAERAAGEALTLLEREAPGPELARLYTLIAGKFMVAWDMESAAAWGGKAIDLADRLGEVETRQRASRVVASANYILEGPDQGRDQLRECLAAALAHGFDDLAATAYTDLGSGQCEMYRFAEADAAIEEGIAFCASRDMDHRLNYLQAWRAVSYDYQGRWPDALKIVSTVLEQPHIAPTTRVVAVTTAGRIRCRQGDPSAQELLDEALELALPTGELQRLGPVRTARAELAWLAGDLDRVRHEASSVYEMALRSKHQWYAGQIAYWLWRAGEPVEVPANAFRPFVAQMAGRWRAAAAEWRKLGCPYEAAIALAESADESDLRFAHLELVRLGARPAAALVAKALRDTGAERVPRGPRPSTQANPFLLTRREMEILALLTENRSTNEIAEVLFLSPRTVGHHITAILEKLGVRTRAEAIAKSRKSGVLPN
jgi:DNA-binding CsgD family transcriptional regulator